MIESIKKEYLTAETCFSEFLRYKIREEGISLTKEEIQELLDWSGDSEYVTVEDVLSE